MMTRPHRPLFLVVPVIVLALALALTATASAEVRTGQGTSPINGTIPGEADLLAATASYDSTAGIANFTVTTGAATGTNKSLVLFAALGLPTEGRCVIPQGGAIGLPAVDIQSFYREPKDPGDVTAFWFAQENTGEELTEAVPASKTKGGTTMQLTASSFTELADKPYSCAFVVVFQIEEVGERMLDEIAFPIAGPPPPSTPPAPVPTPPAATPTVPPAALALGKTQPVTAKVGKWTTVKVAVSDPGGTAVGPITLKATAPAGIVLKPGSGKVTLPALLPGQTWSVPLKVKLTSGAKPKSTIALTATAGALSARGSLSVSLTR